MMTYEKIALVNKLAGNDAPRPAIVIIDDAEMGNSNNRYVMMKSDIRELLLQMGVLPLLTLILSPIVGFSSGLPTQSCHYQTTIVIIVVSLIIVAHSIRFSPDLPRWAFCWS
jgi:hypothetical protein